MQGPSSLGRVMPALAGYLVVARAWLIALPYPPPQCQVGWLQQQEMTCLREVSSVHQQHRRGWRKERPAQQKVRPWIWRIAF